MKQLQGLLALIEIGAAGSFAGAARRLGVTPAAVSKSLARLEEQLGVRLVQRSTRTARVTDEGARFIAKARDALRLLDDAVTEVSQAAREPAGVVRISTGVAFGRLWVLPALPALAERYPQLTIEVELDNTPVDLVANGIDIAIRGGSVPDAGFVARRVCRLPLVLVASPAYLARAGVPLAHGELERHRCIQLRFADGTVAPWSFRVNGRRVALAPHAALVGSDSDAIVELALAGGGIAQCGLYQALPHLQAGRLKAVLADSHDAGTREFVLVYPHRQFLAPRVRVVVDALLAHFRATAALHVQPSELPASLRAAAPGPRPRRTA
ncbi:MAG TPA: LysR family transcriptional regulator [Burkholderiaceae bacterium]|jgi:DNA-binding transcriptional LysR family regulator|nr:LysR family transcriptional regulator [Burkholderiaceae bacterium]